MLKRALLVCGLGWIWNPTPLTSKPFLIECLSSFIDITDHTEHVPSTKLVNAISQVIFISAVKCGHLCLFSSSQITHGKLHEQAQWQTGANTSWWTLHKQNTKIVNTIYLTILMHICISLLKTVMEYKNKDVFYPLIFKRYSIWYN